MIPSSATDLFENHPRNFQANRYVYPVLSRRAGGISIGVNLNIDKICNFDCVYCQVVRGELKTREFVELARLGDELDQMVELVASGKIFEVPPFQHTPEALRRVNDIALSGDGEPTTFTNLHEVVLLCAEVRRRHGLDPLKLVLITNASMFHRDAVRQALAVLDANNGEIWAKLDAGTEPYFQQVARSAVKFQRILDNLLWAAQTRPIVIQSLFMRIDGQPPSAAEQAAYCDGSRRLWPAGGQIKLVQIHTVARPPAESSVAASSERRGRCASRVGPRANGLARGRVSWARGLRLRGCTVGEREQVQILTVNLCSLFTRVYNRAFPFPSSTSAIPFDVLPKHGFATMREAVKVACVVVFMAGAVAAAFAWADDRPSVATWLTRAGLAVICIAAIAAFLGIHFRKDKATDYLRRVGKYFNRNGFCFVPRGESEWELLSHRIFSKSARQAVCRSRRDPPVARFPSESASNSAGPIRD